MRLSGAAPSGCEIIGAAPFGCEIIGAALAVREIEICYKACSRVDTRCGP